MMQFACIKQLEIIGLRTLLVHEYFGVDVALIVDIIQNDLPELKQELNEIVETH